MVEQEQNYSEVRSCFLYIRVSFSPSTGTCPSHAHLGIITPSAQLSEESDTSSALLITSPTGAAIKSIGHRAHHGYLYHSLD